MRRIGMFGCCVDVPRNDTFGDNARSELTSAVSDTDADYNYSPFLPGKRNRITRC